MQEKADRAKVVLPWQHEGKQAQHGAGKTAQQHPPMPGNESNGDATKGNGFGHILYVRDSDNDCDSDEDPDDDLDI